MELLPPEIVIVILNRFTINDLSAFLKSNKHFASFKINYHATISAEYDKYLYPPSALDKVMENIDELAATIHNSLHGLFGISACLLSKTLTKAMNLTTFHQIRGQAIYDDMAANLWWESYIDLLPGKDDENYHYHIYTDDLIKNVFGKDLLDEKVENLDLIPIATLRSIIDHKHIKKWYEIGFTIPLTPRIICDIVGEKEEMDVFSRFYKQSRRFMKSK